MDIPNSTHLALASCNKSTELPPLSPSFWPSQLSPTAEFGFEPGDFQSNGHLVHPMRFSPPLAGLGIRCIDKPLGHHRSDCAQVLKPSSSKVALKSSDSLINTSTSQEREARVENFVQLFEDHIVDSNMSSNAFSTNGENSKAITILDNLGLQYPPLDDPFDWSLGSSISAVSGFSVGSLATQLSTAADLTLQNISSNSSFSSLMDIGSSEDICFQSQVSEDYQPNSSAWPMLPCDIDEKTNAPGTGVYRYSRFVKWKELSVGINPADIVGDSSHSAKNSDPFLDYPPNFTVPQLTSRCSTDSFFGDVENISHENRVPDFLADTYLKNLSSSASYTCHEVSKISENRELSENSDYEVDSNNDIKSEGSSPFPSPIFRKRRCVLGKSKGKPKYNRKIPPVSQTLVKIEESTSTIKTEEIDIDLGTPVFDAHRGILLDTLTKKAERYRLRNPGHAYDRRWLVSFAGKLSTEGKLLDDFRCYISGCTQTNKRRDHILIHVGAHLNQRPFGCVHCPSRFLRRNECKRHEMGHTGTRPYACSICRSKVPPTFVRQDLLRRHMQRKHPGQLDADKENFTGEGRSAKRVKK